MLGVVVSGYLPPRFRGPPPPGKLNSRSRLPELVVALAGKGWEASASRLDRPSHALVACVQVDARRRERHVPQQCLHDVRRDTGLQRVAVVWRSMCGPTAKPQCQLNRSKRSFTAE